MQYARWKEECREMDSHLGSGRIITAPIITEDGKPIQDPLVLLEANPDHALPFGTEPNGDAGCNNILSGNDSQITDKKVIDWKLTLHQIGRH